MESKRQSTDSSECTTKRRNHGSSAVDRKSMPKTSSPLMETSSTTMETKCHCPESREHMSIMKTDGSSEMGAKSNFGIDVSSKPLEIDGFSKNAMKPTGEASASSATAMKRYGKADVSSADGEEVMKFNDVTMGPHKA